MALLELKVYGGRMSCFKVSHKSSTGKRSIYDVIISRAGCFEIHLVADLFDALARSRITPGLQAL